MLKAEPYTFKQIFNFIRIKEYHLLKFLSKCLKIYKLLGGMLNTCVSLVLLDDSQGNFQGTK